MPWFQNYDPLGRPWLSTLCAALPMVALLGSLAFLRLRAHTAALLGLGTSLLIAVAVFGMPAGMALASAVYGAAFGLLPIGWIVLNVIFLYQLTDERGLFRRCVRASPASRPMRGCSCCSSRSLRRVLRGRGGVRHAGRGHRRDADRARLRAAGGLGPVADRQHGAGRVRRARHADHRAQRGHRARPACAERHGRPAAAVLLADRAVLAGLGVRRVARDARGLAGDARRRRVVRRPAVPGVELPRSVAGGRRRRDRVDGVRWRCSCASGGRATRGHAAQGAIDTQQPAMRRSAPPTARRVMRAWMPWIILSVFVFAWGLPQVKAALDACRRAAFPMPACTTWCCACRRSCRSRRRKPRCSPQLAVGDRHRHPASPRSSPAWSWAAPRWTRADLRRTLRLRALLAAHDRGDAALWLHDALRGPRRDARPGVHARRLCSTRSSPRCSAGSASR